MKSVFMSIPGVCMVGCTIVTTLMVGWIFINQGVFDGIVCAVIFPVTAVVFPFYLRNLTGQLWPMWFYVFAGISLLTVATAKWLDAQTQIHSRVMRPFKRKKQLPIIHADPNLCRCKWERFKAGEENIDVIWIGGKWFLMPWLNPRGTKEVFTCAAWTFISLLGGTEVYDDAKSHFQKEGLCDSGDDSSPPGGEKRRTLTFADGPKPPRSGG